jgi:lipopolysaccharide cholinephosphotransferase
MAQNLYDVQGYEIKLEMTRTFNPSKAGAGSDIRDLGVLVSFLGAKEPEYEGITYEKDPYVFSRLEFPFPREWNYHAVRDSWGPEENGMWISPLTRVYLKDAGISRSGLKIVYYVPPWLTQIDASLKIWVNNDLIRELPLREEGMFTEIMDVSGTGKEVREYLEKAHSILKILLSEFDRVCQKYGLHYYLICGSLLGAVRHQDLIPWDDDVDVAMPRKDFDELLRHVKDEWKADGDFMFLNYNEMGGHAFLDYMTRLVYMKEEIPVNIFRKIKGKGRRDVDNHLPMDIYVLDNASDNEKFHLFQTQFIRGLYGLAMGHRAYINPADYENRDEQTQKIVKTLSSIGRRIPVSWIFGCYEWVRKWNKNKKCENYFESNGFIYCIPWKFKREWFGEGTRLPLGEITVSVPRDYKAFLEMHYGDFMQYPPVDARKPTHSVEASGIF